MISILAAVALRKHGTYISHVVHCLIMIPEDMISLVGLRHEQLSFLIQAATFNCSFWVPVNQLVDNMPRVSKYQNLSNLFSIKKLKTLKKSHPLSFIISSIA